jgi:hypothetical protein
MDTSVTTNRPSTAALKNEWHGTSYIMSGSTMVSWSVSADKDKQYDASSYAYGPPDITLT